MSRSEFLLEVTQQVADFARSLSEGPPEPRLVLTNALVTTVLIVMTAIRSYLHERKLRD